MVEKRQFGAWGVVDQFWNNQGATAFNFNTTLLDRGYTGHEHLFFVSLINMNGRLYDAKLGRFLSPDNFVQDPYNTQSFNRYGYVVNNPLSFTDESGEFILAAVLIGAFANIFIQGLSGNINSFGDFFLAGAIGAAAGIVGGGFANLAVGGAFFGNAAASVLGFGAGFTAGAAGGFAGGFVGGAGNAWANGASFGDGLGAGFNAGFIGGATGGLMGGISGGIRANKMGLGFWDAGMTVDVSKGAMHVVSNNGVPNVASPGKAFSSLRAKFVGYFEDTREFEAKLPVGDGHYGGVTLPGKGIIVSKGVFVNRLSNKGYLDLLKHEYGHILQAKDWGNFAYYDVIGPESLSSQMRDGVNGHNHDYFWTETHANYHSNNYFNNPNGWYGGFNTSEYPVQGLSQENYLKLSNSRAFGKIFGFD